MRILCAHNWRHYQGRQVETYARSMIRSLRYRGHEVFETVKSPPPNDKMYEGMDLLLDIDCGRDANGNLPWHGQERKPPVKSAVYLIAPHGSPSLHRRISRNYDHVFFAVWDKRDLFAKHPSAHWTPCCTDRVWFDGTDYPEEGAIDFGFFGSKGGLGRAKPLIEIADKHGWSHEVRQVSVSEKHRWPGTAEAMAQCRFLFNHSQKKDLNQRVFESMCMKRPLICDRNERSGIDKLFEPWKHYIPYESHTYNGLEEAMKWCIDNPNKVKLIAAAAYQEVLSKHLVNHRIDQVLEVISG